uniref:Uncharacterized protein n=1 Tax=Minutocellus polymorphus TaxID=265543 RepID=A0A7S0AS94_9STRA|mmetsp:Transcript_3007/g.5095  ORF Transcript_3007/g.5095 Transcript_3007/m.5095 type:complete len:241 (+) Transcript_3007:145-867(+)
MFASSDGETPPTPASQVEPAEYECLPASSSHLDVITFCVDPSAVPEGAVAGGMAAAGTGGKKGVVGTITLLAGGRSAMVWFGWGDLVPSSSDGDGAATSQTEDASSTARVVGSGVPQSMGPVLLSYPRAAAGGAGAEPATTQLVGGDSEEDMVVGHQMAARLAQKVGMPVYVCCSIHSTPAPSSGGGAGGGMGMVGAGMMESEAPTGFGGSLGQKAAALAEREVGRILLQRNRNIEGGGK